MAKSKTPKRSNYRVVIEPRGLGDFGSIRLSDSFLVRDEAERQRQYQERCEEIMADVKRHVDQVGYVSVECDIEHVCEHCGGTWTEESATYNGGCCDKDEEAEEARRVAAQAA